MTIYDTTLWKQDLDEIINSLPELGLLANEAVLITGSTGLICSALTDVLIHWNLTHDEKIRIIAAGRSARRIRERFGACFDQDWFHFSPYDASSPVNQIHQHCDYIIHGASNASPNKIIREPVETMMANFVGTKYLLDHALSQGTKRFLFISSSEVYGKNNKNKPYETSEYGYVDLLNPRNSYAVAKRASETLCVSHSYEYGIDSVIVRPGHIYGPTALPSDNRVSSMWAYSAACGEDIVMKSDGQQIRSYCYCLDCASAMIKVLLKGEKGQAYNISNPDSIINIRGIAEILSREGGVRLLMDIPTAEEQIGFNPMINSSLDSEALEGLGWTGLFGAERGFSHTVQILKHMMKTGG